jgi:hypothetical protein
MSKKEGSTRIYVVTGPQGPEMKQRLVDASTQSVAVRHASQRHFSAKVATQKELVELLAAGVKVEKAGEVDGQTDAFDGAPQE